MKTWIQQRDEYLGLTSHQTLLPLELPPAQLPGARSVGFQIVEEMDQWSV